MIIPAQPNLYVRTRADEYLLVIAWRIWVERPSSPMDALVADGMVPVESSWGIYERRDKVGEGYYLVSRQRGPESSTRR